MHIYGMLQKEIEKKTSEILYQKEQGKIVLLEYNKNEKDQVNVLLSFPYRQFKYMNVHIFSLKHLKPQKLCDMFD